VLCGDRCRIGREIFVDQRLRRHAQDAEVASDRTVLEITASVVILDQKLLDPFAR
jgi:hypothetical protein